MLVLGIDQSLRHSGTFWLDGPDFGFKQVDTGGRRGGERLSFIRDEILNIVNKHSPALVTLEGYAYASRGRVFELGELGGVLKVAFYERSIPLVVVTPNQVKKFATGCASAEKIDVVNAMNERFGLNWVEEDNNLADAAALACIARAYLDSSCLVKRNELEVIAALKMDRPPRKKKYTVQPKKKFHNI